MSGYSLVVAGDDLDGHAILRHRVNRAGGRLLGWIEEHREAGEHQFCLVGDHRRRMIQCHCPIGHAECAAAILADALEAGHQLRPRCLRKGDGATVRLLSTGAQAQYVPRCTLDDQ
jgi:hypothetical protein